MSAGSVTWAQNSAGGSDPEILAFGVINCAHPAYFVQAYITNLNGAMDKHPELKSLSLEAVNKAVGTDALPKDIATVVRNNGGGHWNHSFFWKVAAAANAFRTGVGQVCQHAHNVCVQVLAAPSSTNGPSGELKTLVDSAFGSMGADAGADQPLMILHPCWVCMPQTQ
jgi:superoxide dismutase